MSDREKLEAIRNQARRESAAKAQKEQALMISDEQRRQRRQEGKIGWRQWAVVPVFLAVVASLWFISSQPEETQAEDPYQRIIEAGYKAVAQAALIHLNREGWNTGEITEIAAKPIGTTNLIKVTFTHQKQKYRLTAEPICSPSDFDLNAKKDPDCYTWH